MKNFKILLVVIFITIINCPAHSQVVRKLGNIYILETVDSKEYYNSDSITIKDPKGNPYCVVWLMTDTVNRRRCFWLIGEFLSAVEYPAFSLKTTGEEYINLETGFTNNSIIMTSLTEQVIEKVKKREISFIETFEVHSPNPFPSIIWPDVFTNFLNRF